MALSERQRRRGLCILAYQVEKVDPVEDARHVADTGGTKFSHLAVKNF